MCFLLIDKWKLKEYHIIGYLFLHHFEFHEGGNIMDRLRKLLAVLLSVMVLLSSMPVGVWAEEGEVAHDHDHEAVIIAEEPTEKTTEEPTVALTEEPTDVIVELSDESTEVSADDNIEEAAGEPMGEPTSEPAGEPADNTTDAPADKPGAEAVEAPSEPETFEEPSEEPMEEPAEEAIEEIVEESAEESTPCAHTNLDSDYFKAVVRAADCIDNPEYYKSISSSKHRYEGPGQYQSLCLDCGQSVCVPVESFTLTENHVFDDDGSAFTVVMSQTAPMIASSTGVRRPSA